MTDITEVRRASRQEALRIIQDVESAKGDYISEYALDKWINTLKENLLLRPSRQGLISVAAETAKQKYLGYEDVILWAKENVRGGR